MHLEWLICTHLHHGWRKFWNSMPLDATRMTNFVDTDLHQGWEVTFTLSIVRRRMPAPDTIWHEHSTPTRQIPAAPVRREALLVRRYAEKNGPLRQIYWSNTAWIPPWILASDFRIFATQMSHRTTQLRSQNTHDIYFSHLNHWIIEIERSEEFATRSFLS